MSDRRRGLGKGLGALIPSAPGGARPSDVFFPRPQEESRPGNGDGTISPAGGELGAAPSRLTDEHADAPGFTGNGAPGGGDDPGVGDDAGNRQVASSPHELAPVPGATFAEVPVDAVRPNPRQPRQVFDEDELAELVASIRELGVLQPVVVRAVPPAEGTTSGDAPAYELVMGERRLRATREAGKATIPAIIRSTDDENMLRDALLENLHRAQLNPLEEAAAYQQLLDDFGCTHEELAGRIGRSRPQISNTLRLLKLPPLVQRRVASGVLSAGHARALLGLQDGAAMERLAQRIVAEGLSVRSVEEIVVLGDDQTPRRTRTRAGTPPPPELQEVAASLSERLETRVQVTMGRRRGKITVEFAGQDDLARILEALARP
ncbi:chromosome partitioning protein ParB [Ornithinimicrobium sp. CNJ-824]|uniref:ParB/RepB/Spo0J family partition protein n=1 Tax=Ornithinimicrobium sp. CNJ-824 TaxID=1904966 RepID=UPI000968EEA9|nr:ParB/RepB/Spo0J family partition protein [Ornithinimicrobium sp. CNJ-824]OLT19569.1 chromosome partitioning protein ParB [Ornithinimicrobium sp. CNJ-824]